MVVVEVERCGVEQLGIVPVLPRVVLLHGINRMKLRDLALGGAMRAGLLAETTGS